MSTICLSTPGANTSTPTSTSTTTSPPRPNGQPSLEDITTGFCATGAAIAVADAEWRILAVNATYAAMTGHAPADLLGQRLQVGDDAAADLGQAAGEPGTTASGIGCARHWEGEIVLHHRAGHTRPAWMSVDAVTDARGAVQRRVLTFFDISLLKRQQDEWRHQAEHDALTGLPQRRLFEIELQQTLAAARRHGRRFALLFVDVDHFKRINDTLGHDIGDRLLLEVGQRLRQAVRDEDLVARLGGDEFVVLLQEVDRLDHATALGQVIVAALSRTFQADGHRINVSASVGVALYPGDGDDAAALLRAADAAMYCAKRNGRGRVACANEGRPAQRVGAGFSLRPHRGGTRAG